MVMLPFVLGIVFQSLKLVSKLFSEKWQLAAVVLLLADSTLLAQCTLVSPDVFVIFFFMMALNSIFGRNRLMLGIALAGLTLSSMRGMMCVAGLFISEILIFFIETRPSISVRKSGEVVRSLLKISVSYLPAIIVAGLFLGWHYYKTGWIGYHKNMPWYTLYQPVGLRGAFYNTLILGWRLIDFGRLFIWIGGAYCLWHFYRYRPVVSRTLKTIIIITILIFLSIAHAVILHKGLAGHRYLLPVYLTFTLLVTFYLFEVTETGYLKKLFFWLMLAGILSGNFWVYPDKIAKGWDATLAYLPYFPLREKMMDYMESEGIKPDETGTAFPNLRKLDNIDLNGNMQTFAELNLKTNNYVFYSNVYNDFTKYEIMELRNKWKIVKELRFLQVKVILYKSPTE